MERRPSIALILGALGLAALAASGPAVARDNNQFGAGLQTEDQSRTRAEDRAGDRAVEVAGTWSGVIEIPGSPMEVQVELARDEAGAWSGTIDIPAQNAEDLPLEEVSVEGRDVSFRIAGVPGQPTFEGEVSEDGTEIGGDFAQGGATLSFVLRRGEGDAPRDDLPDPREALADLPGVVEGGLEALSVPGVAVAVVAGDEVVLARGFGSRDLEEELPVTPETVFAIGSTTKAMTATLVGSLVDEGLVSWDEPVRTYLPEFRLADPTVTERLTVRDLLTHRSGLPRHDLTWYGSPRSRDELFRSLRFLDLSADLRERFQYQNLMYMTAGYLAGRVTDSTWEELLRERILTPLAMDDSLIARFEGLPEVATGYSLEPAEEGGGLVVEPVPYRLIDAVGPAGSVNSNAADMARWVRFQLGDGTAGGHRIVSEAVLQEMHSPQMVAAQPMAGLLEEEMSPYVLYGLGWFIQPYRGHHMVQHGGGIDGFSTMVAFLPHRDVGVVVLANAGGTPLPLAVALSVFDRLLGLEPVDWVARAELLLEQAVAAEEQAGSVGGAERVEGTEPSHPLEAYAGEYEHPAYGTLAVGLEDGELRASLNGLEDLPLEHWHYDVFRAEDTPVGSLLHQFLTGEDGRIHRVQVPVEPAVEPIVFTRRPPARLSDPELLARLTGDYLLMGQTVTIALRGDALTAAVPNQPTYELVPHAAEEDTLEFRLADLPGYRVRFHLEDGEVASLDFVQPNGTFTATPVE